MKKLMVVIVILVSFSSCKAVKEYDMQNINDTSMKLSAQSAERYETAFQVYREAAAGANGGKTGGGCGCN
ncbi:MAG TPA: arginine decarboxylase [Flavobacterium sp.]|nr:arginine decarboxylase [Flavobacterium sp.]